MDKKTNEIIEILKLYIKELERNNFPIKETILFGSYAKGNYNEWIIMILIYLLKKF